MKPSTKKKGRPVNPGGKRRITTIYMLVDVEARLVAASKRLGRSRSSLIEEALKSWL